MLLFPTPLQQGVDGGKTETGTSSRKAALCHYVSCSGRLLRGLGTPLSPRAGARMRKGYFLACAPEGSALKYLLNFSYPLIRQRDGAGKTTLLNTLHPVLGLRVGESSQATGKGRHTPSSQVMFPRGR
jgi:hypothetical protein